MGLQSVRAHRILIPNKNIDLHVFICISLNVTHSSRQGLSQTTRARRAWRHHLVQFSVFGTEKGQHQHHLTDVADQWPKSSSGIFCVGQLILFVYELENWSPDSWPIALSKMPSPKLREALGGGSNTVQAGMGLTVGAARLPTMELRVLDCQGCQGSSRSSGTADRNTEAQRQGSLPSSYNQ